MANLRIIRQRIRSVQSTQKITRAMQMVAGSKLRRMQEELVAFRPYARQLRAMTERFLLSHPDLTHPLLDRESREAPAPIGLLLISSDTGLCGTYNERIFEIAQNFLKENPSAVVAAIGKKGTRTLSRKGKRSLKEITDWGGRFGLSKAMALYQWMEELYLKGTVSGWWVAYTQFISAMRFSPTIERFLPTPAPEQIEGPGPERVIVEPEAAVTADAMLRRFLKSQLSRVLLEAFTSEHSARMMSMRNATDNAAEMIEHLTLSRNKARQAAITKELIEVVSGSEALK